MLFTTGIYYLSMEIFYKFDLSFVAHWYYPLYLQCFCLHIFQECDRCLHCNFIPVVYLRCWSMFATLSKLLDISVRMNRSTFMSLTGPGINEPNWSLQTDLWEADSESELVPDSVYILSSIACFEQVSLSIRWLSSLLILTTIIVSAKCVAA